MGHGSLTIGDREQDSIDPYGRATVGARGAAVSTPVWDRELRVLEEALRRLNAEYDAFLYGSASKPPVKSRKNVDEMFRRLNAQDSMPAAERYRFATLQGRYAILNERWARLQEEKEAGRRPGLYGHFQEASPSPSVPNAAPPASVQEGNRGVPAGSDRELYERYIAARKARGEDVSGYRLEGFLEGLERERRKVGERLGVSEVVFEVTERDGRVRLIAKKKPRGAG